MKWLKRIALLLVLLFLIGTISGFFFWNAQKPNYDEKLVISGIEGGVDIHYDTYGIPHIYGDSESDVYVGLGYAHAKDRLWQMELLRRIAPGRLSEILGSATLETDQFFRGMDLVTTTKHAVAKYHADMPPAIKSKMEAYLKGVNHYIKHGDTPIEYRILGIEKSEYTLEDVYNVMGYMGFSFAMAHKTEPVTTAILEKYGLAYLQDLNMEVDTSTVIINSEIGMERGVLSMHVDKILKGLPVPQFIGSNSWVIAPSKTNTGGAIFANDPHIGYSQPSVWYEAHLESPGFSLYGNFIGGLPIPLIGNTRHHAIGLTMFENDDIDLYREKIHEDGKQYWSIDQWLPIESRVETIKVKGGDDVELKIRKTHHGPIMSKVANEMNPEEDISMFWVYQHLPVTALEAAYKIMNATTVSGVQEGVAMMTAPGLNVMYGDIDGNIAWWAGGKLPIRSPGTNPKLILDGSTGEHDITEYYDFEDNPQSINPSWGYVYSANNQSVSNTGIAHPGYYLPEDRGRRIKHLLDEKSNWSVDDVKEMITDVTSMNTPEITKLLLDRLNKENVASNPLATEAVAKLESWQGNHQLEDIAPTIYYKWLYLTLQMCMEDEVGEGIDGFLSTHLMKRSLQPLIANSDSPWWDDVNTPNNEDASYIIQKAFVQGLEELQEQLGSDMDQWTWNRVHSIEHGHALGANETLKPYFNVGPYEVKGSREVINNLAFALSGDGTYEALSGPSCRRVINMSDVDSDNWSILPTGQSGNRWSPHYSDQAEMYNKGLFRKQLMNKEEILEGAKHRTEIRVE